MLEARDRFLTLDLALRVGEILLSSGAGAADTTATMLAVTHHLGLRGCDIDVTFTSLRISYQARPDEPAILLMRQVRHRDIDYDDLTRTERVVTALLGDEIDRDEARNLINQVVSTGHSIPRWAAGAATGLAGAGVSLLLGGDVYVMAVAFLAALAIDLLKWRMSRRRLPGFYQQVAGGMVATGVAVVASALLPELFPSPSTVITASVIMLLAGIGFMGAIQDALTGFYITAGARILEALLATAGIIAGVSATLAVAEVAGFDAGRLVPGITGGFEYLPFMMFGGGLAAASFALACYAPWRSVLPIGFVSAGAIGAYQVVVVQGFDRTWAAAVAALLVGVVAYSVARFVRVPPLVVVVPAIVPMLPGLSIYRGLALIGGQGGAAAEGIIAMVTAASVAIALASGVILGEYIAQPLRREVQRLEQRLAGPRLVGPLRARSVSASRRV